KQKTVVVTEGASRMTTKKHKSSKPRAKTQGSPRAKSPATAAESTAAPMSQSDPQKKPFTPEVLDRTAIAIPLLKDLMAEDKAIREGKKSKHELHPVIIDMHLEYPGGRDEARKRVAELVEETLKEKQVEWDIDLGRQGINKGKSELSNQYLFAVLDGRVI